MATAVLDTPTQLLDTSPVVSGPVFFRGLPIARIDGYEARLEQLTLAALRRVMRQVTAGLGHVQTAAGVLIAAEAGAVSPGDLSAIMPLWQQQVDQTLMPVVGQVYRNSSRELQASLVEQVGDLPPVSSAAAEAYLA